MMNFLSLEKKKNDPLAPAPWPALKTFLLFFLGSKDLRISRGVTPDSSIIERNFSAS